MNGPEHYAEAEKLLVSCQILRDCREPGDAEAYAAEPEDDGRDVSRNALMAAQVHATLALAAAQVDGAPEIGAHVEEWVRAVGGAS